MANEGFIDFCGFHLASAGWLFCGWISIPRDQVRLTNTDSVQATVSFEGTGATAPALVVFFSRNDIGASETGVALLMSYSNRFRGRLTYVELEIGEATYRLNATQDTAQLRDVELIARMRGIMAHAVGGKRNEMMALLSRRGFTGADTVESLTEPVRIGIDEVIICQPDGVVLIGWSLSPPGVVTSMKLFVGSEPAEIDDKSMVRVDRLDVADSVGAAIGLNNRWCGFIAYLPIAAKPNALMYLQIETRDGEVGYLNVKTRAIRGMPAILRMLNVFEANYGDVKPAYERVLGPALQRLNADRLSSRPLVSVSHFGTMPAAPRCSVIIPLYGRMDFLEYQIALMSEFAGAADLDIIYVLDDPPRRHEVETLAESVWLRFGIPFKLLLLSENVGFAPANNIGLAYAKGEFICFLNSDVFPADGAWIGRLCDDLEQNPDIGAIGGLLLFEDGSVQHEGMAFETVPALGGFSFPLHNRKGWRPRVVAGIERMDMITGACMVMTRQLAAELGGFDERYIIGDFEDCDLCARIVQKGLTCAVDHDVRLFHLERKSQVTPDKRWRLNLTLYNAWLYDTLWLRLKPQLEARRA